MGLVSITEMIEDESTDGMPMDKGVPKYSENGLSQCHFVHHKSHMDCSEIKHGPLG
jgi:hypothetical protein